MKKKTKKLGGNGLVTGGSAGGQIGTPKPQPKYPRPVMLGGTKKLKK